MSSLRFIRVPLTVHFSAPQHRWIQGDSEVRTNQFSPKSWLRASAFPAAWWPWADGLPNSNNQARPIASQQMMEHGKDWTLLITSSSRCAKGHKGHCSVVLASGDDARLKLHHTGTHTGTQALNLIEPNRSSPLPSASRSSRSLFSLGHGPHQLLGATSTAGGML